MGACVMNFKCRIQNSAAEEYQEVRAIAIVIDPIRRKGNSNEQIAAGKEAPRVAYIY
jgi:hypothetical protein